jgi:Ca-activated chloride channel family protein
VVISIENRSLVLAGRALSKGLGTALVIAIDSSASMMLKDVKPNRLEAAKRGAVVILRSIVGNGTPTLVGIVSFYGSSFPVVDLTDDVEELEKAINSIKVSGKATNLSTAIKDAFYMFKDAPPGYSRRLIVISDGDFNEGPDADEMQFLVKTSSMRIDFLVITNSQHVKTQQIEKLAGLSGGKVSYAKSLEEAVKSAYKLALGE